MHNHMKKVLVEIVPDNRSCQVDVGKSVQEVLDQLGINLIYPCGSNNSCGKCAIQFEKGAPPVTYSDRLFFAPEQLQAGFRLACNCNIVAASRIRIPEETRVGEMVFLTQAKKKVEKINPVIEKYYLKVTPPSLENLKSDEELIEETFFKRTKKNLHIPNYCLTHLPQIIRKSQFEITTTVVGGDLLVVEEGDATNHMYGIAVDIGTTTLVVGVHDLISGRTLGVEASMNPNMKYGDDLISRVTYVADDNQKLRQLQILLVNQINELIEDICRQTNILQKHIYVISVAGNAVMNHLFLGINPKTIALAPYTPVFKSMKRIRANDVNLDIFPEGLVYILPNLGGFVGGDIIADMLVAGFGRGNNNNRLLIDIGTNCEVVLEKKGICIAASSPAGPALEGARITHGMRAEPGAIYDVQLKQNDLTFLTIKDTPAKGICGSGLFHLVDTFYSAGLIQLDGRISDLENISDENIKRLFQKRITNVNGAKAIRLTDSPRELFLTQKDVRDFQLARSAIVSAWEILCKEFNCSAEEIDDVYIAGAFGNYIRPETALKLALVPNVGINHIHFIGNAALEGARMVLVNKSYLEFTQELLQKTKFMELGGRTDFQESFITNLYLP